MFTRQVRELREPRELVSGSPPSVASASLGAVLAGALDGGDAAEALDAVAAEARAARAAGRSPNQVAVLVRRALAAGAPGAMTAAAFDAVARRLVQHALRCYFDVGGSPPRAD